MKPLHVVRLIFLIALGVLAYPVATLATSDARPEEPQRTQQQQETQQAEHANNQMSDVPISKERKRDLKRQFKKVAKEVKAKFGPNRKRMPDWVWLAIIGGAFLVIAVIVYFIVSWAFAGSDPILYAQYPALLGVLALWLALYGWAAWRRRNRRRRRRNRRK